MSKIDLDVNSPEPVWVTLRQGAYEYRFQAHVEDVIVDAAEPRNDGYYRRILTPPYYTFTIQGTVVAGIGSKLIQRKIDLTKEEPND